MSRLERIADVLRRTTPDMLRLALEDYATEEERKLGIGAKPTDYLVAAEEPLEYKISKSPKSQPQLKLPQSKSQKADKN